LLVVIAVLGILIAVILPALSGARTAAATTACASNLRQLGLGVFAYLDDWDRSLPQVRIDDMGRPVDAPNGDNIGALFGGKRGALSFFGIDRLGAAERPLNPYVTDRPLTDRGADSDTAAQELDVFQSPADKGTNDPFLLALGFDTSNTYELIGTSYNLNDHALDTTPGDEMFPTLVPKRGGDMPRIRTPNRTWLIGSQPIYNYDDGGDRDQRWYGAAGVRANLFFADGSTSVGARVPRGQVQTTSEYTFLPEPRWLERFGVTP
jgi:hypothetical protein